MTPRTKNILMDIAIIAVALCVVVGQIALIVLQVIHYIDISAWLVFAPVLTVVGCIIAFYTWFGIYAMMSMGGGLWR